MTCLHINEKVQEVNDIHVDGSHENARGEARKQGSDHPDESQPPSDHVNPLEMDWRGTSLLFSRVSHFRNNI